MLHEAQVEALPRDRTDRLISLNKMELLVGILVGLVSIAAAMGSYIILPYRVADVEKDMVKIEVRVAILENATVENKVTLASIDGRLQSLQEYFKIKQQAEARVQAQKP